MGIPLTVPQDLLGSDTDARPVNWDAVHAFFALNLISGFGLVIVLLTAIFSSKVKRMPTWYNFCASWVLSCFSYSLLFFARQHKLPHPNFQLCYIQTGLIYALPPTTSCTTLALLVQLLMSFPESKSQMPTKTSIRTSCLLLIGPYTIFIVLFIGVALYTSQDPISLLNDRRTYCHSSNSSWSRIAYAVVATVSVASVLVQSNLALRLYMNPQIMRQNSHSVATMLRVLVFALLGVVMAIVAIVFAITGEQDLPLDIVLSIIPFLALLVFGTQKDLIQAWLFWKQPHSRAEERESRIFGPRESQVVNV
ncbi:unnamed protein product [Cyclocybe aegerita]|uniref:Uncharacterized protein n=1 Tax=Cyclocybe aegerita TaxID=1973307 RepID=A0A8S0W3N6_CYCAE|nr:unnamed protein product [Cyclocybe aegerita]